jgi:O-succinylhomoserine sulfhydrylase
VSLVDGTDLDAWRAAFRPETRCVFLESMSNPTLEVIDIAAVAALAHAVGAQVVVDNVFPTPVFQRCLALGADVVIYSATKHIDGQGRCLGGIVLGRRDFIRGPLETFLKHTGGALSPFNAWVMLKGLETLDLRCRAQAATAQRVAEALRGHPALDRVIYPGLPDHPQAALTARQMETGGTMLAFELAGGKQAAFRFLDALEIVLISNNLGDSKSLVTHPATTTHQRLTPENRARLGIGDGLVRLSIGLEDPEDLLADIERALGCASKAK